MCSANMLNTDLWSYSNIGEKAGEKAGVKALKGRVGTIMSVFSSVCSGNLINPDI